MRYRKKPVEVEAMQVFTWRDALDTAEWIRRYDVEVMVDAEALEATYEPV